MNCLIEGCGAVVRARGLCNKHWQRWSNHGDPLTIKIRPSRTGSIRKDGYIVFNEVGGAKLAHVKIAERIIGKSLPKGCIVHHMDCDPRNNDPGNLLICPSQAYHLLIHSRTRAFNACGNADWKFCRVCKKYDVPENLRKRNNGAVHLICERRQDAERKRSKS